MSDDEELSVYDEVEIEDMTYDETLQTYFYPCPCGDQFQIALADLQDEETDIAVCPSCSLMIRVIYEVVSRAPFSRIAPQKQPSGGCAWGAPTNVGRRKELRGERGKTDRCWLCLVPQTIRVPSVLLCKLCVGKQIGGLTTHARSRQDNLPKPDEPEPEPEQPVQEVAIAA